MNTYILKYISTDKRDGKVRVAYQRANTPAAASGRFMSQYHNTIVLSAEEA